MSDCLQLRYSSTPENMSALTFAGVGAIAVAMRANAIVASSHKKM
jgi:hypothetical protein